MSERVSDPTVAGRMPDFAAEYRDRTQALEDALAAAFDPSDAVEIVEVTMPKDRLVPRLAVDPRREEICGERFHLAGHGSTPSNFGDWWVIGGSGIWHVRTEDSFNEGVAFRYDWTPEREALIRQLKPGRWVLGL